MRSCYRALSMEAPASASPTRAAASHWRSEATAKFICSTAPTPSGCSSAPRTAWDCSVEKTSPRSSRFRAWIISSPCTVPDSWMRDRRSGSLRVTDGESAQEQQRALVAVAIADHSAPRKSVANASKPWVCVAMNIRAIGKIVGAVFAAEELVKEGGLVGSPARGIELQHIRIRHAT